MASFDPSFDVVGPLRPESPVVISVPHAGRDYPSVLGAMLRVPVSALATLEDRLVDALGAAARGGETMLVQRAPRAWIDLNRAETERDPRIDEGAAGWGTAGGGVSGAGQPVASAKVRSGLGLVPRRTAQAGELWSRRLSGAEVEARIAADHRPYHAALGEALAAARGRFGAAVLLDLHSMPSIAGAGSPQLVLGDRFGRAAAARFVHRIEAEVAATGPRVALNAPYAGGHILDRHARPAGGIHGIQLEIDRALYLDRRGELSARFGNTAALLRRVIAALADEALARPSALAAE